MAWRLMERDTLNFALLYLLHSLLYYPLIQQRITELWEKVVDAFSQEDKQYVTMEPFFRKHY